MKKRPFIIGFDTEDDSRGTPTMFAFVCERGKWTFETRDAALDWLLVYAVQLRAEGFYAELWATNLEYDLVNLFDKERIAQLSFIFGKSYLVAAEWRRRNVKFRDTVRHLPISVAEWGELVGLPKLEKDLFKGGAITKEALKRRCTRDASITYRAAKTLYEFYGNFDISPKLTLASSALRVWMKHHWKKEIYFPETWIVDLAREAYFGGRTEAFAIGDFQDVRAIDAASMFPWAMVNDALPLPWGMYARHSNNPVFGRHGIYRVRVAYDGGAIPVLPYRTANSGLIYPIGVWEAVYTSEEIEYAKERGYRFEPIEGVTFLEECWPFSSYVHDLFKRKQKARGPMRLAVKLLLNALYGKFAQRGEKIEVKPLADFLKLNPCPEDFRVWNGLVIYNVEEAPPKWGSVVWPAFVTARARLRLHSEMERVQRNGGTVLYSDTDGLLFRGAQNLSYPGKAARPGTFEFRGSYPNAKIAGKKEYGLQRESGEWEIHIKGVPFAAREIYLRTGKATYEKPVRIKESARRDIAANHWIEITKVRRVSYAHRSVLADGTLAPIVLSHNDAKTNPRIKGSGNGT